MKLVLPCGTKFLGVLIFEIFAIRQRDSRQKYAAKIFPAKVYSYTVEIIYKHHLSHEQKEIAVGKLEIFSTALRLTEKNLV